MAKNILKKSLALGVLMTFLITGSVWAAEVNELGDTITVGGTSVSKPSSSDQATGKNIVAMGQDITYNTNTNKDLVLLGKSIDADGNRLVYIGANINKVIDTTTITSDDIKSFIQNNILSTTSTDSNQVAIGSFINVNGKNSVAIGMGVEITENAKNSVAIGSGSQATESDTVSFGRYLENGQEIKRKLTHVAEGTISKNSTDAVNAGQLYKEQEERKYSDLVLSNTINKEIEDRKYADTVLNNALIKETEERKYSDLVLSNTINKEIEDRKYADTVLNNKLDAEIDRSLSKDVEHDTKLQHITADADGTYIEGTTYFNKDTDNQVIINQNGIKVGLNSVHIDSLDVSIEDPKDSKNRIALSDVGQVDNIDSELKANASFDQTIVGAINAEANLRRVEINRLGSRVDKVGAGAAALAALHPLDFDPDDKLQFSAGVGNYAGETATALGAFYRPTEKVMFNVSGTMGTGEDMVNAGITFALDGRNNVSNSRVAMAHEIQDLRAQVAQLTSNQAQMMALLNKVLDGQADELLANVMFPDVPENHWAYEYLNSLQKRGILKGYPDGTFGGDRSLTRYEYAAMLYRVLEQGIPVDTRLLNEFEAELGRIRIDRIKSKDDSYAKIERIRVVNNADRDDYGNKIITVSSNTAQ